MKTVKMNKRQSYFHKLFLLLSETELGLRCLTVIYTFICAILSVQCVLYVRTAGCQKTLLKNWGHVDTKMFRRKVFENAVSLTVGLLIRSD